MTPRSREFELGYLDALALAWRECEAQRVRIMETPGDPSYTEHLAEVQIRLETKAVELLRGLALPVVRLSQVSETVTNELARDDRPAAVREREPLPLGGA